MRERTDTNTTGRKLKKLLIVAMLVCYVPLTSGCVQYVMLAMMVVQGVSGMVAQQREDKGRREAWQKGEPYIRDAATSNWGTASSLAGLGAGVTSFGAQTGMWGQGAAAANSGQQGSGASEWINPDTGKPMSQGNSVGNGGQNSGGALTGNGSQVNVRNTGRTVSVDPSGGVVVTYSGQTANQATETASAGQVGTRQTSTQQGSASMQALGLGGTKTSGQVGTRQTSTQQGSASMQALGIGGTKTSGQVGTRQTSTQQGSASMQALGIGKTGTGGAETSVATPASGNVVEPAAEESSWWQFWK